ncbi:MAG: phenylalanine--tRNA ligase subunit alpha [Deltaproteobacteria bacterium]|nr:phenylalanine--tRNA ligase subunit alpha [Deltaproteobacteria bacterium]
MLQKISDLKQSAFAELLPLNSEEEILSLKVKYLGKKGLLTNLLKDVGLLDPALRPQIGQASNEFKKALEEKIGLLLLFKKQQALAESLEKEKLDISLPGTPIAQGSFHPVSIILKQISDFFMRLGFDVFGGPEVENDFYNFEALGLPPNHPARDMQDTFYLGQTPAQNFGGAENSASSNLLLRTHTSPVQIRVMEKTQPPIRMIAPGVVYRRDSDLSHTPMFHQVEGLVVDEQIHFSDLKGLLKLFLKEMFGEEVKLQFRPSFFPFTEPSAEVDISCVLCKGSGCRVCKNTGWIEILGCGMVDPVVFSHVKYDSEKYSGFAFGMGVERIAMLKFGIDDLRAFFESDVRFLKQF